MTYADDLRASVEKLVAELVPLRQFNVSAVGTTTVDLEYGDSIIPDVPCSSGYSHRQAGDKVWVIKSQAGNWEVLARSNATDEHP